MRRQKVQTGVENLIGGTGEVTDLLDLRARSASWVSCDRLASSISSGRLMVLARDVLG
jgi:hypothetical protein